MEAREIRAAKRMVAVFMVVNVGIEIGGLVGFSRVRVVVWV